MKADKCECRFANEHSSEMIVCDICSDLPYHNSDKVLKEIVRSKGLWLVEAWMEYGEAKCSIFKGTKFSKETTPTWECVPESQLIFVPAKVLAANVKLMEKAKDQIHDSR